MIRRQRSRVAVDDGRRHEVIRSGLQPTTARRVRVSIIIRAQHVVTDRRDNQQLPEMPIRVEKNFGRAPDLITADAGYRNERDLQRIVERKRNILVAPERVVPPARQDLPPNTKQGALARKMRTRLSTAEGRKDYLQRQATAEPVLGCIKSILGL